MMILKWILRIALAPVLLLITLAQWIGSFFTGIASVILGLLSSICWIVAILGYLMGICSGRETVQMMIIAFVAFIIPECCSWFIDRIAGLRSSINNFLRC